MRMVTKQTRGLRLVGMLLASVLGVVSVAMPLRSGSRPQTSRSPARG